MTRPALLVVDDNVADVELVREAVAEVGLAVDCVAAADGGAALAELARRLARAEPLPALMLLDLNMPRIDGFAVIAAMRADPRLTGIPIAVLTTSASPRDQERCRAAGVDRYLVKPNRLAPFLDLVRGLAPYFAPGGGSA